MVILSKLPNGFFCSNPELNGREEGKVLLSFPNKTWHLKWRLLIYVPFSATQLASCVCGDALDKTVLPTEEHLTVDILRDC